MKTFNRSLCPRCKDNFLTRHPAISRRDNKTQICAHCGTQEALEDSGLIPNWLDLPGKYAYWDTTSSVWMVQCEKLHDAEQGLDELKAAAEDSS